MNAIPASSKIEPSDLWKAILQATREDEPGIMGTLRVPLWLHLLRPANGGWMYRLKTEASSLRQLLSTSLASGPKIRKGGMMFCFPFKTASNLLNLVPVAREAMERGCLGTIVANREVIPSLFELGSPPVPSNHVFQLLNINERWSCRRDAKGSCDAICAAFLSIDPGLAERFASRAIFWRTIAFVASCYLKAFPRLIEEASPVSIISTSEYFPFEYSLFASARKAGIRSAVLQHGLIAEFWSPFNADAVLLWGRPFKDQMLNLGAPSERLAVCGMPASDAHFQTVRLRSPRRGFHSPPIMVILSDTHGQSIVPILYERFAKFLTQAIKSIPTMRWQVKLHPIENDSFYQALNRSVRERLEILPKETTLDAAVSGADWTCTLYSAAGLEAMMLDRPLVVFDIHENVRKFAWWPQLGGGTYIKTVDDLADFIRRAGTEPCYQEILIRQAGFLRETFANPGNAANAVFDYLGKGRITG